MEGMFKQAYSFNQPLDKWDTSRVTNMELMFYEARAFNQNINAWNTSLVVRMYAMFEDAVSFNQSLDKWDTNLVRNMAKMFEGSPLEKNPPKWYEKYLEKTQKKLKTLRKIFHFLIYINCDFYEWL